MRSELSLLLRLTKGARGRDLLRFSAVIITTALVGLALALGLCVAQLGFHESAVEVSRQSVRSEDGTGPRLTESTEMVADRQWTRVVISAEASSIEPPAGLESWPSPGTSAISPALADLAGQDGYRDLVGALRPTQLIGSAGLRHPGELYSYTVLRAEVAISSSFGRVSGFNTHRPAPDDGGALPMLIAVILVLAGPAAIAFHSACRFLASSRARRFSILLRIGIPRARLARMFAVECTVLAATGMTLGFVGFNVAQAPLGSLNLLGISWWASSGELPMVELGLLVAASMGLAWRTARAMIVTPSNGLVDLSDPPGRAARLGWALVAGSSSLLVGLVAFWTASSRTTRQPEWLTYAVLAAVGAGFVGLLVSVARSSPSIAARAAKLVDPTAIRLGLSRAAHFSGPGQRLISALIILSVFSGATAGFITGVGRWGVGYDSQRVAEVLELNTFDPATRAPLLERLESSAVVVASNADHLVVAGTCLSIAQLFGMPALNGCHDDRIQAGDGNGLSERPMQAATIGRGDDKVEVPSYDALTDVPFELKLPTAFAGELSETEGAAMEIPLVNPGRAEEVFTLFHSQFPEVPVQASLKDSESYELARHYSAVFRLAFASAVLISVAALSFLALELVWANARQASALAALGVGRRRLRVAGATQAIWPVIAVAPAVGFGILAGLGLRSYFGTTELLEPAIFSAVLVPWVAGLAIAAIVGASSAIVRFSRSSHSDT